MIRELKEALDGHAASGGVVDLWWRDDDAVEDGPSLARLLDLARSSACPLALAVIPARLQPSLARALTGAAEISVMTHGLLHANHAPPGQKRAEFGPHRPLRVMAADILAAKAIVDDAFGPRAVAAFAPPWNRIAPDLVHMLPDLGFEGLSAFGGATKPAGGSVRIDTHLDPVDWRGGGGLASPAILAASLAGALGAERPVLGFLTHHLAFEAEHWAFCRAFLALVGRHPAVRLRSVSEVLDDESRARLAGEPPAPSLVEERAQDRAA